MCVMRCVTSKKFLLVSSFSFQWDCCINLNEGLRSNTLSFHIKLKFLVRRNKSTFSSTQSEDHLLLPFFLSKTDMSPASHFVCIKD